MHCSQNLWKETCCKRAKLDFACIEISMCDNLIRISITPRVCVYHFQYMSVILITLSL